KYRTLLSTPPGVSRVARRQSCALFLCRVRYFRLNFWDGNGSPPDEKEAGSTTGRRVPGARDGRSPGHLGDAAGGMIEIRGLCAHAVFTVGEGEHISTGTEG